ncbi:MAG: DNA primase [Puniceicoccales bacterium]|nr:DNA primase [Puniceicoccales bacterium]
MIKRECIERIKAVADLYDIASSYVQLKRSGSHWKGLSPFTAEKTPSFFVLPEKRFFKCFSTGYAGDVFRFLELKENFSFIESVEWLAKRYGIAVEYESNAPNKGYSKNELFAIHESAAAYFRQKFLESSQIQYYWQKVRQFSLETAERYGIGWAPPADRALLRLLQNHGYAQESLEQSGLFLFNENYGNNLRLRFAGRLMIPIFDVHDRTIGFSGRIIEKKERVAKYINSPESPIFYKGSVLYGLNHARKFVDRPWIIVEGQLDAIRCWESGIHEAIASQGTGVTEAQIHILRRYTSKLLCLMDGDSAGQKCALRVVELSFKTGIETQIATLPEGKDPDFLLQNGDRTILDGLRKVSMIQFSLETLLPQGKKATAIEKEIFLKKIYAMIRSSDAEVTRMLYLNELAEHLNLDALALKHDFQNFCSAAKFPPTTLNAQSKEKAIEITPKKSVEKLRNAAYDLLSLVLHHSDLGPQIAPLVDNAWLMESKHGCLLLKVLNEIQKNTWEGPQSQNPTFSASELNELFSILATDDAVEDPIDAANACIQALCIASIKDKLKNVNLEASQKIKFTENENLLDDIDFFRKLQDEKLRLRQLLISCPKIKV